MISDYLHTTAIKVTYGTSDDDNGGICGLCSLLQHFVQVLVF